MTSQYQTAESVYESRDAKCGRSPRKHYQKLDTVDEKNTEENTPAVGGRPLGNSPGGQTAGQTQNIDPENMTLNDEIYFLINC